ncbi:MAG: hypothetical protein KatS3mg112_1740 [Thermogutta sp.]|nr:MAG: hypothetical protein KatS3mg112_1740 [Thermogutta sp.]
MVPLRGDHNPMIMYGFRVRGCVPGLVCRERKLCLRRVGAAGNRRTGPRTRFYSVKNLSKEASRAMALSVSRLIQALEPSATMAMAAKAKELKASGRTVYDLSLGEPDFPTPEHICQAAIDAMKAGHTHYTVASGIPELKRAVVEQYKARYGLTYPRPSTSSSPTARNTPFTTPWWRCSTRETK